MTSITCISEVKVFPVLHQDVNEYDMIATLMLNISVSNYTKIIKMVRYTIIPTYIASYEIK